MLIFSISHNNDNTLSRTLWEAYALEFFDYKQKQLDPLTSTLILLQHTKDAKVKEEGCYIHGISTNCPSLLAIDQFNIATYNYTVCYRKNIR